MTTFFRIGSSTRQPNPVSQIKTAADAYVAAHANPDTGTVTDPSVYAHAKGMLAGDNTPAGLKAQAEYQNKLDALKNKLNNAYATKGMIDYNFKNAQYTIGKTYALNPAQLIAHMYGLYDFHATQIENHIQKLTTDGQNASALQVYGGTIADEASQFEKLFEAINTQQGFNSNAARQAAQHFGIAIGTDDNGKVTSFALHVIPSSTQDARLTLKGANDSTGTTYVRTNATYGGIPMYVIPQSDPNDSSGQSYVAKVGNLSFSGLKKSTGQEAMTLTDNRSFFTKLGNVVPDSLERIFGKRPPVAGEGGSYHGMMSTIAGGVPTSGNKAIAASQGASVGAGYGIDLLGHIQPDDFSNMTSLPAGTVAVDAAGTYHYVNDNGQIFSAPSADIMSKNIGIPSQQIKSAALPITSNDLELLNSQQSPDQRANAWMSDPTENSPLNQTSPTSILTSPNQPGVALSTPAAPPGGTAPPQQVATKGKQPGIQQPAGAELQQQNTQQIAGGQPNLPNAGQTPAVA